jgi:signal transduction histidine kinase
VILGIWGLLTVGVAASASNPGPIAYVAAAGSVLWSVFFALLLLLMPYLARSRQIVREFALLAAITTAATALNLLFVSVFGMDTLTALTLTVLSALIGYTFARQWLLDQSIGRVAASTDRLFGQIYTALSAEDALRRSPAELAGELLTDVFAARATTVVPRRHARARVSRDGATMTVPLPGTDDDAGAHSGVESVELHEAQYGRRLFTLEDARWAERVLAQFSAALAVQRAREQGRIEERQRLAQDLHDDIGARLLTLLYKAPSRDIEDYIRNTITDLKTLTRGLASGNHHLIDAAAEWRTDAGRRLEAAQVELDWSLHTDRDIELTVVQWSALTRVLRELVSNVIAHAQASTVWIRLHLEDRRLMLSVEDDGIGGTPGQWPHGLGLGGVRKRVKQMNGEVQWTVGRHGGIRCEIHVQGFGPEESPPSPSRAHRQA